MAFSLILYNIRSNSFLQTPPKRFYEEAEMALILLTEILKYKSHCTADFFKFTSKIQFFTCTEIFVLAKYRANMKKNLSV